MKYPVSWQTWTWWLPSQQRQRCGDIIAETRRRAIGRDARDASRARPQQSGGGQSENVDNISQNILNPRNKRIQVLPLGPKKKRIKPSCQTTAVILSLPRRQSDWCCAMEPYLNHPTPSPSCCCRLRNRKDPDPKTWPASSEPTERRQSDQLAPGILIRSASLRPSSGPFPSTPMQVCGVVVTNIPIKQVLPSPAAATHH